MNRKSRPKNNNTIPALLPDWKQHLMTRRRLLLAAGGLTMLFPLQSFSSEKKEKMPNPWYVIDVVQQHLFPIEDKAPGAHEINALAYLQFVVTDNTLDADSREFFTKGAMWLEGMANQLYKKSFIELNSSNREKVLKRIASSKAGENWLSTILLYLTEALLSDPVYGGNTDQIGWKWLQHIPGYPRPPSNKTFPNLLL